MIWTKVYISRSSSCIFPVFYSLSSPCLWLAPPPPGGWGWGPAVSSDPAEWPAVSPGRQLSQSVSRQRTFGDYLFHQYFSLFSTSCFVNTINTKYQVFSPKFQSNWFFLEEKCPVKVLQFTFKWWSWDIYHNKIKSRVKCM